MNRGRQTAGSVAVLALAAALVAAPLQAGPPGGGRSVKLARPTWDTGWFQSEIYARALEALGYRVQGPVTLQNPLFYQSVGQGGVDLWVNGWFPLHNTYRDAFEPGATVIGYVAKGGALQGYLIDKRTAGAHGIETLEAFKDERIRRLFDSDNDGKAELVACPPGWGCELVIEHHLDAYGLRDYVDPIKAGYSASMADAIGRYQEGRSIFFYTWTPNWTLGLLKPGEDVVWIGVDHPDLPDDQADLEAHTTVSRVKGCVSDPCPLGWPANDIRPVANKTFLDRNPAVEALLEAARIPIEDIYAQNAKMNAGEDSKRDLERHAEEWIERNRGLFDGWVDEAARAASD